MLNQLMQARWQNCHEWAVKKHPSLPKSKPTFKPNRGMVPSAKAAVTAVPQQASQHNKTHTTKLTCAARCWKGKASVACQAVCVQSKQYTTSCDIWSGCASMHAICKARRH